MNKKMENISVEARDGLVFMTQDDGSDDGSVIAITPEQSGLVCRWILEAAGECAGQNVNSSEPKGDRSEK